MSLLGNRWIEITSDEAAARSLIQTVQVPLPIARILVARGYALPCAAEAFLNPDVNKQLSRPFDFPGIAAAAERIWKVIREKKKIIVYGDFDVDGVVATATLVTALRRLGAEAEAFLPIRNPEGYGLTFAALERCLGVELSGRADGTVQAMPHRPAHPALLVTVDCGINSVREVEALQRRGIEVIITDHHEPGATVPPAAVVVNPRLGATPGAEQLCGAGVAFKLVHALVEMGRAEGWYTGASIGIDLLAGVGLATVADVVPLTGENRVLVSGALKHWNRAGIGLQMLHQRALQRMQETATVHTFGFLLGPRINAAGRMCSAEIAYQLLTATDRDQATELAAKLEGFNAERRSIEARILAAAMKQCGMGCPDATFDASAVVVGDSAHETDETYRWHHGVVGIVAARLSEAAGVPAAVIAFDAEGTGRGSVRAGEGYHAIEALQAATDCLEGFGGHARAAGFSLRAGCFDAFKEQFSRACAEQCRQRPEAGKRIGFDGWLDAEDVSLVFHDHQQRLSPFGEGNATPIWGIRNVKVTDVRVMGHQSEHVQMAIRLENGTPLRAVWFRRGGWAEKLRSTGSTYDLLVELSPNDFRNERKMELRIIDMREQ